MSISAILYTFISPLWHSQLTLFEETNFNDKASMDSTSLSYETVYTHFVNKRQQTAWFRIRSIKKENTVCPNITKQNDKEVFAQLRMGFSVMPLFMHHVKACLSWWMKALAKITGSDIKPLIWNVQCLACKLLVLCHAENDTLVWS